MIAPPNEQEQHGIVDVILDRIPRSGFGADIVAAIEGGWAEDSDPFWQYADMDARPRAKLTVKGESWARSQGWVCQCPGCGRNGSKHRLAWPSIAGGWCSLCYGSARQFGIYDGVCGFHFARPRIVEERRRRMDSGWAPEGVVRSTWADFMQGKAGQHGNGGTGSG